MTSEQCFIWFVTVMLFLFITKWLDDSLFYTVEKKYCDKFKGNCEECTCWSCKRKDYLNRGDKN